MIASRPLLREKAAVRFLIKRVSLAKSTTSVLWRFSYSFVGLLFSGSINKTPRVQAISFVGLCCACPAQSFRLILRKLHHDFYPQCHHT